MLSQKAKYALKAMIALAESEGGELLKANDIAEQRNIPKKFLDLILLELRRHQLVESRRGKKGGFQLPRPASAINIGDVVRAIDGPLAPLPCASVTDFRPCLDCADPKSCTVRKIMRAVRDAASGVLDNLTLAEAIQKKPGRKGRTLQAPWQDA